MKINKRNEGEIVSNTLQKLHPLINISVDSGSYSGSPSKYMTIYHYFCIQFFLDNLKVKIIEKNAPKRSKTLQNAPNCTIQNFFRGSMPPNPIANAWLRHASQTSQKGGPLGKSCIRPWTTTEKFI